MTQTIIRTSEDRIAHIEQCKAWDAEWRAEHGGNIPPDRHYENVGDIGHERLYVNTPDWIVEIAVRRCWISECGEKVRQ